MSGNKGRMGEDAVERELRKAHLQLGRAYDAFDLVSDPDLIEAWIYEINAWQARYGSLLRQRKSKMAEDEVGT